MEGKPDWLPGFPVQIYCNRSVRYSIGNSCDIITWLAFPSSPKSDHMNDGDGGYAGIEKKQAMYFYGLEDSIILHKLRSAMLFQRLVYFDDASEQQRGQHSARTDPIKRAVISKAEQGAYHDH